MNDFGEYKILKNNDSIVYRAPPSQPIRNLVRDPSLATGVPAPSDNQKIEDIPCRVLGDMPGPFKKKYVVNPTP